MAQFDTYRVSLVSRLDTVNIVNSFFFQEITTGNIGSGPLVTLYDILSEEFVPAYLDMLSSDLQMTCVTVRRLEPGMSEVNIFPEQGNGSRAAGALPATCYGLLRYSTLPRNSSDRNHVKISGISKDDAEAGQLDNAFITAANEFLTQWFATELTDNGYEFNPIKSRKPADPVLEPLPRVEIAQFEPCLRNTRNRDVYVCTG